MSVTGLSVGVDSRVDLQLSLNGRYSVSVELHTEGRDQLSGVVYGTSSLVHNERKTTILLNGV